VDRASSCLSEELFEAAFYELVARASSCLSEELFEAAFFERTLVPSSRETLE
jgi:hypothetical protein